MNFSRRRLFSALAGLPLVGSAFVSKKANPVMLHPADVKVEIKVFDRSVIVPTGLWFHVVETGKINYETFAALREYVANSLRATPNFGDVNYQLYTSFAIGSGVGLMRSEFDQIRSKAIENKKIAVVVLRIPPRTPSTTSFGFPPFFYLGSDLVTYKPLEGPIKFIKSRWQSPDICTEQFSRYCVAGQYDNA